MPSDHNNERTTTARLATDLLRSRLAIFVGALLLILLWFFHVQEEQRLAQQHFQQRAHHASKMLHAYVERFAHTLQSAHGLYVANGNVSEPQWRRFLHQIAPDQRFPSIRAIGFTPYDPAQGDLSSRAGSEEPMFIDYKSMGGQIAGAEWRLDELKLTREAAMTTRDSGHESVTYLPGEGRGGLYLSLLPVYRSGDAPLQLKARREAFRGWVTVLTSAHDFFADYNNMVGQLSLALAVYQPDGEMPPVYSSGETALAERSEPWRHRDHLVLANQNFPVVFQAHEDSMTSPLEDLPLLLGALSLAFFTWMMLRRLLEGRERALVEAQHAGFRLRKSEARYRHLFESSSAISLLVDTHSGEIVDANAAAARFYGTERTHLRGMSLDTIEIKRERLTTEAHERPHIVARHRTAQDDEREVEIHSGPVELDGRRLDFYIIHDVTDQRTTQRALSENERKYRSIVETTAEGFWICNARSGRIEEVNSAMGEMLGMEPKAILGHLPMEFAHDDYQATMLEHLSGVFENGYDRSEMVLRRSDGGHFFAFCNATALPDDEGNPSAIFSFFTDITEQKRILDDLRIAATFFDNSSEAIAVTDRDNRIIEVNPAFSQITGYEREEIIGQDPKQLSSGRHDKEFYQDMWRQLQSEGRWQGEVWNRRKNGEVYPEWLSIFTIRDDKGEVVQHMAVFSDISRRKQDEETIWLQANYDALTGLANRSLFIDRVAMALRAAEREKHTVAVMMIDLDRFKWINETLGHTAGDDLVQQVADRLVAALDSSNTVARFSGDEFTVLVDEVDAFQDVDLVAEDVLRSFNRPFMAEGKEIFLTASVGVSFYPHDGDDIEALMQKAESAMFRAKDEGRNTFRFFTPEMNDLAHRRLQIESDLRRAIDAKQLQVYYQPIVDRNGDIAGAESLLRWFHPEMGPISPDEYIPLAEELGLIIPIEQQVLAHACREAVQWNELCDSGIFVSVNVTSSHCSEEGCMGYINGQLKHHRLDPNLMKLEFTERMMMEDTDSVLGFLNHLRDSGVKLAVDDFGTGYSSLSYLKRFPIDTLKIDRAFIKDLPEDNDDRAMVEAIIVMSHSLGISVVAEGIETADQFHLLQSLGCDYYQGYYFGHPMKPEEFRARLTD